MVSSVDPCFSMCSYECGFLEKVATSVQVFSALILVSKFLFLFCPSSPPLFPCWRGRDCHGSVSSVLFFTLVTSALSVRVQDLRESGCYSEEMLKLELELDQAVGELLDPALLPEKCLCNYTVNVVFMPVLYKTY